jgi:carbamoyl-phosphate synthase large subunit
MEEVKILMFDFNILFTSVGRRVSLVRHFKKTLNDMNLKGKIITTDVQKNAPASFVADINKLVPRVTDPNYINFIKDICRNNNIKLLIPLIDTELLLLAQHKEELAESGTMVLVSSKESNEICFDKRKTYDFFIENGFDTAKMFDISKVLNNSEAQYPFLMKPSFGSCSVGVTKINNSRELEFFKDYIDAPVLQELLVGDEYTVDVLVDFHGVVRSVVPRLRIETRAGEVSKGITVKNQEIIAAAKKVAEALPGSLGCLTVQCFLTPCGDIKFVEINPRFGGGFPLSLAAGADFPRWIIEMMLGINPKIDDWEDGVAMLRYDDEIFVTKEMIT